MDAEDILEQVDILEYISQYCELEEKGGEWWGLSPFKKEKTPSFSVNTEKQKFYDFSSGLGGSVINFVKAYHKCNLDKALMLLEEYIGNGENKNTTFHLMCTKVAKKYMYVPPRRAESTVATLPKDHMERYEFNKSKLQPWIEEGIDIETLKKFEVRYDSYSNRIVYPIKNYDGDIINVGGRTLCPDYKEKGLRKYTYFHPLGTLDTLYGFSENKKDILEKSEIILFEGAKSVMIAHSWGIHNTSAILTSHLNPNQLRFLVKLGVKVVFALDEDVDITKDININKLKRFVKISWVRNQNGLLQEKMAPVDAGIEVWKNLYERRVGIN
jgi:DNA primase